MLINFLNSLKLYHLALVYKSSVSLNFTPCSFFNNQLYELNRASLVVELEFKF